MPPQLRVPDPALYMTFRMLTKLMARSGEGV